jgi:hypothetical protein
LPDRHNEAVEVVVRYLAPLADHVLVRIGLDVAVLAVTLDAAVGQSLADRHVLDLPPRDLWR